jgi:hypothetical protein
MHAETGCLVAVHGVAINRDTLQTLSVIVGWHGAPDPYIELTHGDRVLRQARLPEEVAAVVAFLSLPPDGGLPQSRPLADPINLDRSPRNRLRDRLARRQNEGLLAAMLVLELVVMALLGA